MAYLRQMRVERMARQLCSSDLSIAAAARAVGWTDAELRQPLLPHLLRGVADRVPASL